MGLFLKGRKNWSTNPSFAVNAANMALARVAHSVDTNGANTFTGRTAGKFTVNNAGGDANIFDNTNVIAVAEGDEITAWIRWRGVAGRGYFVGSQFRTAADAALDHINSAPIIGTGDWQTTIISRVAPANAKWFRSGINQFGGAVSGIGSSAIQLNDTIYANFDVSINQAFDTFIDGDSGPEYYWTGAKGLSASARKAVERIDFRGENGLLIVTPRLWIGDKQNNRGREITDQIISGTIEMRSNRDVKMEFTGELLNPSIVNPYTDYLIPTLMITYADGHVGNQQVGLFSLEPMAETTLPQLQMGKFTARDLTWNLAQDSYDSRKTFAAGSNYVSNIISVLASAGLTRFSIPATTKTLPKAVTFKTTDSKLNIINRHLKAINYVSLFADMDGVLTSFPWSRLSDAEPAIKLVSGKDSTVVGAIEKRRLTERIVNVIHVVKEDFSTSANSIDYTYVNDHPESPVSTVALGRRITLDINDSEIESLAVAKDIAEKHAERAASLYTNISITTLPDPYRSVFEVYDTDILMDDGTRVLKGKCRVDGWDMGFTPSDLLMTHFVNKLEKF
jgi:hypothetical protein